MRHAVFIFATLTLAVALVACGPDRGGGDDDENNANNTANNNGGDGRTEDDPVREGEACGDDGDRIGCTCPGDVPSTRACSDGAWAACACEQKGFGEACVQDKECGIGGQDACVDTHEGRICTTECSGHTGCDDRVEGERGHCWPRVVEEGETGDVEYYCTTSAHPAHGQGVECESDDDCVEGLTCVDRSDLGVPDACLLLCESDEECTPTRIDALCAPGNEMLGIPQSCVAD
jgi:hypothetical protein